MSGMPISAVSTLLGVPVPTIRSWERRYGFPTPSRTGGRHRRYTEVDVVALRTLRDEITRGHPAKEAVARARARLNATGPRGAHVDRFLDAAMSLDPAGLRQALDAAAESLGVDAAIQDVVLPAMREVGARWRSDTCDVANEHLATEAVRGWLARHAALAPPAFRAGALILACGPKDLHTVGLEAFGVVLARRGWRCHMLGALTPVASLVTAIRTARAVGAVIAAHRSVTRRAAAEAVTAAATLPGVSVFYAGNGFAAPAARRDVPGTYLGDDLLAAAEILESTLLRS